MQNTNTFRLNGAQLDKTVQDNLASNSTGYIANTLNTALKNQLSSALTENGYTVLAGLIQNMGPVDISANKDVSLRDFVANQVQSKVQNDVVLKAAVDEAINKLSTTTTVEDLLGLNMPIKDNPLFKEDAQKAALSSLLATSPALADPQLQEAFINLYAQHEGSIQDFWSNLREQSEFKAPGIGEEIQFTLQLGLLTQYNVPLVAALQALRQQGTITSVRDLARFSENDWTLLIDNPLYNISIPASIPGTTHDEQVANYVQSMIDLLRREFPTAFVARAVAQQPEIHTHLVKTVLAQNPHINPGDPMSDTLNLTGISEDDQEKAKKSMEVLRQEITMFPAFDHQQAFTTPTPTAPSEIPTIHEMVTEPSTLQNPVRTALSQFFTNAPEFDFHTTHIDTFITEHGDTALKGIDPQLKKALPAQLKKMQRVFRVTPDPTAMNTLLSAGLDSAHAIAGIPQPAFIAQFQGSLGSETQAQMIHDKAQQINALATTTFGNLHQQLNDVSPRAVGSVDQATMDAIKSIPNWTDLFGRLDLCDCDQCRSVYSPAAYFVDLLQFLNKVVSTNSNKTPQQVLFERRPDLQFIELTCENTNTTLPYVDLVNEILETYVALDGTNVDFSNQTAIGQQVVRNTAPDVTADELSATPAYTNDAAYDKLKQAIYPLTLPYNRPLEIARTYLQQLGSSRFEVMKTFQRKSNPATLSPSDVEIACESLTISPEEHAILIRTDLQPAMYGYSTTTDVSTLKTKLAAVPEMLNQTGIQYADLLELLKTRFLNPAQALSLTTLAGADPCDLDNVTLNNLDDATLKKLHRFIRLWQKTAWTIRDLDKVLYALAATDIDDTLLQKLAPVKQLQAELNIPLVPLLSMGANIDADGGVLYDELYKVLAPSEDSLYNKLFQNKAVRNADFADFKLVQTQGKWELDIVTTNPGNAKISTHISTILAVLRISAPDLVILTTTQVTDDTLNLSNLSMLYRFALLVRALKAFIKDFALKDLFTLMNLTGKSPFAPGDPSSTRTFVDIVNKVSKSGFSISQLNYIYQNLSEPNSGLAPSQKDVDLLFTSMHDGLKKIANDTTVAPDPTGDLLRRKLSIILEDTLVDIAMKIIDGGSTASQAEQAATFIDNHFATFLNATEAKTRLLAGSTLSQEERFAYVLTPLMAYLRVSLSKSFVKQSLSDALKLDIEMVRFLFNTVIQGQDAADVILSILAMIDGGLSATYFNNKDLQSTGTPIHRVDPGINFTWPSGSPDPTIPGNTFSVEWTGKVLAQYSETYTFYARTNDGVRLWINNQLLIDDWKDQPVAERSASLALSAGQYYDLRMDYYSVSTPAVAELRWSSPSITKMIIPQDQLSSGGVDLSEMFRLGFTILHKGSMLVNTFGMTLQEATYLSSHSQDATGFDFQSLLMKGFTPSLFEQWERLVDLFSLRNSLSQGEVRLIDVFETTTLADLKDKLHAATNWDSTMIDDLSSTDGFGLATIDAFKSFATLLQLQHCVNLSKRLGVPVLKLFTWAANEPDPVQAQAIKDSLKAMYDNEQWLSIAKSLNDGLREKQKEALIAYILQMLKRTPALNATNVTTSSQLYEYFLIDVDRSSCLLTSRIVQANATIQLFVQRCLMNLEPEVLPNAIDANEWQWMKQYRLWEANRKVFLYPENWIEPELRDDKTSFFKELETELLQNDITLDTAEQAFLNYLEKLDPVARLEICGMYWQEEDPAIGDRDWRDVPTPQTNILHVFGRTFAVPHIYYYRQLLVNTMTWTPWEKVNVDIEGDHLIPVVYNRRLYILWPIFTEKSDPKGQSLPGANTQGTPPSKQLEIKLAWSEYKQNKWSAKQVSADTEATTFDLGQTQQQIDRGGFVFKAIINSVTQQLVVVVYSGTFATRSFTFTNGLSSGRGKIDIAQDKFALLESIDEGQYNYMTISSPGNVSNLTLTWGYWGDDTEGYAGQHINDITMPVFQQMNAAGTPATYDLLYSHQFYQFVLQAPFFYQDDKRTYFVSPEDLRFGTHSFQPNSIMPPLNPATAASAITNNGSNAGNPPIFDRSALRIVKGSAVAVSTPAALAPVGIPAVAQSITDEPSRMMTQPRVVSGSVVSAGGPGTALPDTASKDLTIRPFGGGPGGGPQPSTRFFSFYHPYVSAFIKLLNQGGIPSLLTPNTQKLIDGKGVTAFETEYNPNSQFVDKPYPPEDVDFDFSGAYSLYNWELFFHAPMLIATRLSKNQRFAEAQQWFHYIFNPTDSSTDSIPQRYWKVLPFQETVSQRIQDLLMVLDAPMGDPGRQKLEAQVQQWRDNPFNPHLIARMRHIAYQKNVVMKYIDNLIAWGDQLFQQDTMESINQATGLYILAYEILGPRPEQIPMQGTIQPKTYHDLTHDPSTNPPGGSILDNFSNAVVSIENIIQGSAKQPAPGSNGTGAAAVSGSSLGSTFYFCIPQNDKLLSYWDTVEDRLFKIRHCMNIEGVVQQLSLFAPPIDVSLLVQAVAMGVDLSSALSDINAAVPHYRFTYMLQKALELCADVKSLGGALLSALEKKDAEALALLRATQETSLLKAARFVKEQQLEEANTNLQALQKTHQVTEIRHNFYQNVVFMNDWEVAHLALVGAGAVLQAVEGIIEVAASSASAIPNFDLGLSGWAASPVVTASFGGSNVSGALQGFARSLGVLAALANATGAMSATMGSYQRRADDWHLQEQMSAKELEQIDKQIDAAKLRIAIAQRELDNHDIQIQNASDVENFMRDKYTNAELYDWMISQVSAIYFQCYQMAYDLAKRAEKAFRFERGITSSNFFKFGYWDSLKKGLLSGERLYLDLKRLEMAYIDQNKREYEITKHISLVLQDPLALITLKETGTCFIDLPEMFFDMDYPGHYMRRIKNITLTIPCVAGPYTSINCTLTLQSSKVRIDSNAQGDYHEQDADPRFVYNFGAIESIATSTAQNDSGLFELNFRDERYLPFEGSGVISRWSIDMPRDCNAFDFETITDVILKINYTAREGGKSLQTKARGYRDQVLHNAQTQQSRLFSAKHEFSSDWYRFLHPADTATSQMLALDLSMERFPFLFRGMQLNIQAMQLFLKLQDGFVYDDSKALTFTFGKDGNPGTSSTFKLGGSPISTLPYAEALQGSVGSVGKWILTVQGSDIAKLDPTLQRTVTINGQNFVHLNPDAIEDLWIVCQYSIK